MTSIEELLNNLQLQKLTDESESNKLPPNDWKFIVETDKYIAFAGGYNFAPYLSNWYLSDFKILTKYNKPNFWNNDFPWHNLKFICVEQFMMACKAMLMKDKLSFDKIMNQSINQKSPAGKFFKRMGRQVKNFDQKIWDKYKLKIVILGCYFKFKQNDLLNKFLIKTKNKTIYEASPWDRLWGIGIKPTTINLEKKIRGKNLLGIALMNARKLLM